MKASTKYSSSQLEPLFGIVILKDLLRNFPYLLILLVMVFLAFFMINKEQENRLTVTQLDLENTIQSNLEEEYLNLRLEHEVYAAHYRVSQVAQEKIGLDETKIENERVIKIDKD